MTLILNCFIYILFSAEQARLVSILAENFGTFFIGLKYIDATYTYEWASGEYLSYTEAWDHSQPGKKTLEYVLYLAKN